VATKHTGAKKPSVSPAQSPTATPSNQLELLRNLHAVMTANWFAQQGIEAEAEAILTRNGGGILMDNPQRKQWEDYFYQCRDHRRAVKGLMDELDTAIWRTEKAQAASVDTLQDWYANARTTGCECGGHKKAERNEGLAKHWLGELESRGLRPDGRKGQFNGDGAS